MIGHLAQLKIQTELLLIYQALQLRHQLKKMVLIPFIKILLGISFSILGQTITDTENGTWSFTDDKTGLTFTDDATSTASTSTIVKLTNGELKLRDEETKYVSTFVGK